MNHSKRYNVLIITPATIRPAILYKTLSSFWEKCFWVKPVDSGDLVDYRYGLHIDAVGDPNYSAMDVVKTVEGFINPEYIWYKRINIEDCSLANAFYCLWEFASACVVDYVFYLEDDWELISEVDMPRLCRIMDANPNLATLRLNRFASNISFAKQWNHLFDWTGEYFKCPDKDKNNIGWCGHPGLVRLGFIKDTMKLLTDKGCPERQMKGLYGDTPMRRVIQKWDYGVYSVPGSLPLVRDLGRQWRVENNIIKYADTSWQAQKGESDAGRL